MRSFFAKGSEAAAAANQQGATPAGTSAASADSPEPAPKKLAFVQPSADSDDDFAQRRPAGPAAAAAAAAAAADAADSDSEDEEAEMAAAIIAAQRAALAKAGAAGGAAGAAVEA